MKRSILKEFCAIRVILPFIKDKSKLQYKVSVFVCFYTNKSWLTISYCRTWSIIIFFRVSWYFDFIIVNIGHATLHKCVVPNSRSVFKAIGSCTLIPSQNSCNGFWWNSSQQFIQPFLFKLFYAKYLDLFYVYDCFAYMNTCVLSPCLIPESSKVGSLGTWVGDAVSHRVGAGN